MIVTNTTGQTDILERHVARVTNDSHRALGENEYSVTQLLKDATAIVLGRRHRNEITRDIQDLSPMSDGTDKHEALREDAEALGYLCEQELVVNIQIDDHIPFTLTGKLDFYRPTDGNLTDYKNTKQSTYKRNAEGTDDEWERQVILYNKLLDMVKPSWYTGVRKMLIQANLSDVSKVGNIMKGEDPNKLRVIEFTVPTEERKDEEIRKAMDKVKEVRALESVPDELLPPCSEKYRYIDVKFKIYKRKTKNSMVHGQSAVAGHANYKTYEDTREGFEKAGMTDEWYVIEKKGSDPIKCLYYCDVCEFCPYWKSLKKEKANGTD